MEMLIVWITCKYSARGLALRRCLTNDINHCHSDQGLPKPCCNHDIVTLFSAHSNQRLQPPHLILSWWQQTIHSILAKMPRSDSTPFEIQENGSVFFSLSHQNHSSLFYHRPQLPPRNWRLNCWRQHLDAWRTCSIKRGHISCQRRNLIQLWHPRNLMTRMTSYSERWISSTSVLG